MPSVLRPFSTHPAVGKQFVRKARNGAEDVFSGEGLLGEQLLLRDISAEQVKKSTLPALSSFGERMTRSSAGPRPHSAPNLRLEDCPDLKASRL
jgi:hypothetical protein